LRCSFCFVLAQNSSLAFYMLPMRAWQLLIGAILAVWMVSGSSKLHSPKLVNLLGCLGFCLVLLCLCMPKDGMYDLTSLLGLRFDTREVDGFLNIIITFSTALAIYSGTFRADKNFARFLLSLNPVVFIGKISYSLYLWHWPIFVFANHYYMYDLPRGPRIVFIIISFVVAYLSWRFIEQPVRKSPKRLREIWHIRIGVLACFGIIAFNFYILNLEGFTPRHQSLGFVKEKINYSSSDLPDFSYGRDPLEGKILGSNQSLKKARYVLLGDSHAKAILPLFETLSKDYDKTGIFIHNTCLMESRYTQDSVHSETLNCGKDIDKFLVFLEENPQLDTVFLVNRWTKRVLDSEKKYYVSSAFPLRYVSLLSLVSKIEALGRSVVILKDVPIIKVEKDNVISIYWRLRVNGADTKAVLNPTRMQYLTMHQRMEGIFERVLDKTSVSIIRPLDTFCPQSEEYCIIRDDGGSWYFDDDHLSNYGAQKLRPLFEPYFE